MRTLHFCACALALAGCVETEERSTNFNYLHAAIIEPSCATIGCHSEATQAGGPTIPMVDLSGADVAYKAITGVECGDVPSLLTVISPSDEDGNDYQLMHLLLGRRYPDRYEVVEEEVEEEQMPPDQPLPAVNLALIRQWLEAGAPCE